MKRLKQVFIGILGALILFLGGNEIIDTLGGVTVGNEYTATTTPFGGAWTQQQLALGWGSLGSVIVTTAGDLEFVLYDATSTVAVQNKFWASGNSSSTQQLGYFPASLVAGTYTFDVLYNDGLVMDVLAGSTGTLTITFR